MTIIPAASKNRTENFSFSRPHVLPPRWTCLFALHFYPAEAADVHLAVAAGMKGAGIEGEAVGGKVWAIEGFGGQVGSGETGGGGAVQHGDVNGRGAGGCAAAEEQRAAIRTKERSVIFGGAFDGSGELVCGGEWLIG